MRTLEALRDSDDATDFFSSAGEFIVDQVMRDIPARMLLVPKDGSNSDDPNKCVLLPLLRGDLTAPLMIKIMNFLPWEGDKKKFVLFEEAEEAEPGQRSEVARRPMPFPELTRDLREAVLEKLYGFTKPRMTRQTINPLRLFRRCWEIMSGEPRPQQNILSHAEFSTLWKSLRRSCNGNASLFHGLGTERDSFKPGLLLRLERKHRHVLFFRLRKKVTAKNFLVPDRQRIGLFHLEDPLVIPNPFYEIALHVCKEANRLIQSVHSFCDSEKEEKDKDHAFLTHLKTQKILAGCGEYQGFSLKILLHPSGTFITLLFKMGERPFLQQVSREPVYVYWDLRRHPISILMQLRLEDEDLPLTAVTRFSFFAESNHPSVWRHAFVRQLEGHEAVGTICTEQTNQRILSLQKSSPFFDPVVCMLEQMKGAARILRYGVRERDKGITQHNPFHKVDRSEFQAVIEGEEEARQFAMKEGAEIIPYAR